MHREIEFRFWSGTKMFYDTTNVIECLKQQLHYNNDSLNEIQYDHCGIHKAEFLQYTGLKDKNGKKIFDGDIIEWESHNKKKAKSKVYYSDIQCPSVNEPIIGFEGKFRTPISLFHACKTGIIIGNIHEHPQLLNP